MWRYSPPSDTTGGHGWSPASAPQKPALAAVQCWLPYTTCITRLCACRASPMLPVTLQALIALQIAPLPPYTTCLVCLCACMPCAGRV